MKSKSFGLEGRGKGPSEKEEEEMVDEVTGRNKKLKVKREEDRKSKVERPELSRKQLLHLLEIMEGEVQVVTLHQYLICSFSSEPQLCPFFQTPSSLCPTGKYRVL